MNVNAKSTQRPLELPLALATALLAVASALTLKILTERLNRRGVPVGTEGRPEFRGHP